MAVLPTALFAVKTFSILGNGGVPVRIRITASAIVVRVPVTKGRSDRSFRSSDRTQNGHRFDPISCGVCSLLYCFLAMRSTCGFM